MRFVCSFAWADGEIQPEEHEFVRRMLSRISLKSRDRKTVLNWLDVPPRPEQVDPLLIPVKHAWIFLDTVRIVIAADQVIHPDEQKLMVRLERFLTSRNQTKGTRA